MPAVPTSYGYPIQRDAEGNALNAITSKVLAVWLPKVANARFGVVGADDWRVTVQNNLDRGVRINAGTGWGDGVLDVFDEYETISLPFVGSGSQWFLIARRRNWTAPASTNSVVIPGTATKQLPLTGVSDTAGEESDQPLALVRVDAGETVVAEIVDLRCFAGPGGVSANDRLALTYLAAPGATVRIGQTTWEYQDIGNNVWDWVGGYLEYQPLNVTSNGATAWTTEGTVSVEIVGNGRKRVTVDILVRRAAGAFNLPTSFVPVGALIPSAARGASVGKYKPIAVSGGSQNILAMGFVNTTSGIVSIRGIEQFTFLRDSVFSFNCFYYI